MTARTQRMQRHALAASYRNKGLWTFICSCDQQFTALVKDDAARRYEAHQDTFDDWREQAPVELAEGRETECIICGAVVWTYGASDVVCRRCENEW